MEHDIEQDSSKTIRQQGPQPPTEPENGPQDTAAAAVAAGTLPRPHVLVAEDNDVTRAYLAARLKEEGLEVEVAHDGREAVERWKHGDYALILMDLQMPVLDGIEASRTIRLLEQQSGNGYTPIVAMTAHEYLEDAQSCQRAGIDGYISKPFQIKKAMKIVREFVGRKR